MLYAVASDNYFKQSNISQSKMLVHIFGHDFVWWLFFVFLTASTGKYLEPCNLWPDVRYFDGYCYYISNITLTVPKAKIRCEQMHKTHAMKLAEPRNEQQYGFLKEMAKNLTSSGILLGGIRDQKSGTFVWLDGEVIPNWWGYGQPDNYEKNEECVEMRVSYGLAMNDIACNHSRYFACEKYIGDPCESVLAGSEYMDGYCFKLSSNDVIWNESMAACHNDGGFLAEPRTLPLLQLLLLLIKVTPGQFSNDSYFLGASDEGTEGTFRWLTTNEPVILNYWGPGEPSKTSSLGLEHYLTIKAKTMRFNDEVKQLRAKFFCQKDIMSHEYLFAIPVSIMVAGSSQLVISSPDQNSHIIFTVFQHVTLNNSCGNYVEAITTGLSDLDPIKYIYLYTGLGMDFFGIFEHYVKVRSSQELTVLVSTFMNSLNSFSITATVALNIALLRQNYFLLSFPNSSGQLTVTAIYDGTDVILKVPSNYQRSVTLAIGGASIRQPVDVTFTLDRYHTAIINTTELQSGFISATQAITVYSFTKVVVQDTDTILNSVADIIIPIELMSSEYITFPSWPLSQNLDNYQMLAIYDNTNVVVHGRQAQSVSLSKSGDVQELSLPGSAFYYMKSDIPFQVKKATISIKTGTCVSPLLPVSLWHTKYAIFPPSLNTPTIRSSQSTSHNSVPVSAVVFLISKLPQFSISNSAKTKCQKIEGTNMCGCYFEILWETSGPIYITNNGTRFAAYALWIQNSEVNLMCYPLDMDVFNKSMENFDGHDSVSFMKTTCDTTNDSDLTTVDSPESTVTVDTTSTESTMLEVDTTSTQSTMMLEVDTTFSVPSETMSASSSSQIPVAPEIDYDKIIKMIQSYLGIDHKNTSQYRRSKFSAVDVRVSSIVIGLTGVTFVTIIMVLFVFSDILNFIRFLLAVYQTDKVITLK